MCPILSPLCVISYYSPCKLHSSHSGFLVFQHTPVTELLLLLCFLPGTLPPHRSSAHPLPSPKAPAEMFLSQSVLPNHPILNYNNHTPISRHCLYASLLLFFFMALFFIWYTYVLPVCVSCHSPSNGIYSIYWVCPFAPLITQDKEKRLVLHRS